MIEVRNARIASTNLGFHDGFGSIPNFWLHMEGEGWGQGFGGYKLGGAFTHDCIYGILNALEVDSWEKLKGTLCRIERSESGLGGIITKIGHIYKDRWFDIKSLFTKSNL